MKYSELISFSPIESTLQLIQSNSNKAEEINNIKTYVMSEGMAQSMKAPVIDQLQMDEVVDNKGVLIVGNYGTGKSHLMSVISSIAKDADNLQYLQNKTFAKDVECIAGKFEVLRIEIGGVTMSLYDILSGYIQDDFDKRNIDFEFPEQATVRNPKKVIQDMMIAFAEKYPDKIKQKASVMADSELNRFFYQLVYGCLDWDAKQYVPGFEIYQRDLNWDSHNIFREGYLFLGLPGERSTAQPERDFYIHIMPPYSATTIAVKNLEDEVYFFFKSSDEFKELLGLFAAANSLAQISEGKDKDAYLNKAGMVRKRLIKYLGENKNTCFEVQYKGQKRQMIEVLKGRYNRDMDFKDTVDLAA